jgi:SAM-dependent methyltransferase
MGGLTLYAALAPIYDDWQTCDGALPFAEVAGAKLEPILRGEARGARDRPFAFLDVGCGTGTLLAGLRARHRDWRLAGADGAAEMLAVASRKPGGRTIAWARARLDAPPPFAGPFDAAGCFYDTLNHLTDGAALAAALAGLASVLRPGGLLTFDVTNDRGFAAWWRGQPRFGGPGWSLAIDMRFDHGQGLGAAELELAVAGRPRRRFQLVQRYFPREAILQALAAAGLEPVTEQAWAPFAGDIAGKTWWAARRR